MSPALRALLFLLFLGATLCCPARAGENGVLVETVFPGSPAERAGIQVGDRLAAYGDRPLASPAALSAAEENPRGSEPVRIRLVRAAEALTFTVPAGQLGVIVLPALPPEALALYRAGRETGDSRERVARWTAAAEAAGSPVAAAYLHRRAGGELEGQRRPQEARASNRRALELHPEPDEGAFRAELMAVIGRCSRALHEISAAEQSYEQAVAQATAAGCELWAADFLSNLGSLAYYTRQDLDRARELWLHGLAIRERLDPPGGTAAMATLLELLGTVDTDREILDRATEYLERSLKIRERLPPPGGPPAAARTHHALGVVAYLRGDLDAAESRYTRSLNIFRQVAPESLAVAAGLNNLGILADERGDLRRAQEYYARSLAIVERLAPGTLTMANDLHNLGVLARGRGELELARHYHRRALAIRERLAPPDGSLDMARSLIGLGVVERALGDLDAARSHQEVAIEIAGRLAPDSGTVAAALLNLGNVVAERALAAPPAERERGFRAAEAHQREALRIREQIQPDSLFVARILNDLADTLRLLGNRPEARRAYQRSIAIKARLAPRSLDNAISIANLGMLAFEESRFAEARRRLVNAVTIVEAHRGTETSSEARALATEGYLYAYAGMLLLQMRIRDPATAFATLERSRARALAEMIAEREAQLESDASPPLRARQRELDRRRAAAYHNLARLDPRQAGARIDALRGEIEHLAREQRELTATIQRASPRFASLRYPRPLDLRGARAALDPGTLLLSYFVDEEQTALFALTRSGGLRVFRLPVRARDLREDIARFRAGVLQRAATRARGRALYRLLVRPAGRLGAGARRVLICPDGPLNLLPFGALDASRRRGDPACYLAELKPLHRIVSMTVYAETIRRRRPGAGGDGAAPPRVLAFGDPTAGAPDPAVPASLARRQLVALPGTRAELAAIARLYGTGATLRVGAAATAAAARREAGRAKLLHFACHGLLDDRDPFGSALVLAPSEDDGLLRAWQIARLRLRADLVVLSACDTGLGVLQRGEGVVGLTRALQYAGARSVVVSLWSVADESTARLMETFYRELKRGASKDVALQRAMAAVRRDPRWRHPFYWAPFALTGDWR